MNENELEKIYQEMITLDEVITSSKIRIEELVSVLKNEGVTPYELFPDKKKKIVWEASKDRTMIPPESVFKELPNDDFLKVVKVVESSLKKLEKGEEIIQKYKKVTGKTKENILVKKMTLQEIKESEK